MLLTDVGRMLIKSVSITHTTYPRDLSLKDTLLYSGMDLPSDNKMLLRKNKEPSIHTYKFNNMKRIKGWSRMIGFGFRECSIPDMPDSFYMTSYLKYIYDLLQFLIYNNIYIDIHNNGSFKSKIKQITYRSI